MSCVQNFNALRAEIPVDVKIVAVSKNKPVAIIEELYNQTGHRIFGENKAKELKSKHEILPDDIQWHFIGHLQTNKIRLLMPYVSLIQSIDSFRLLREINKEAIKCNRNIPCLLQFYIANEETKFGFSLDEAKEMLDDNLFYELSNIKITGVMGMATFTNNQQQIRTEFKKLYSTYNTLKMRYFATDNEFCEVSMGMSDDYQIAINEGSTIVRIGSGIFGEI